MKFKFNFRNKDFSLKNLSKEKIKYVKPFSLMKKKTRKMLADNLCSLERDQNYFT